MIKVYHEIESNSILIETLERFYPNTLIATNQGNNVWINHSLTNVNVIKLPFSDFVNKNNVLYGTNVSKVVDALNIEFKKDNYNERWDSFNSSFFSTWQTITLPNTPINRIVKIQIRSRQNNNTVGVRCVGTSIDRTIRIDTDSSTDFLCRTNDLGQIQVICSSPLRTDYYVEAYL